MVPEEPWRKHADELTRFATALVGPADAEDLVASSYLRAVTSRQWPSVTNRRAYLFRALANGAANHHRSVSRRRGREHRAAAGTDLEAVGGDAEALALLTRLSVRQRSIAWMAYWLDAPTTEIADVLGVSRRTVDRELNRIRQQLQQELT